MGRLIVIEGVDGAGKRTLADGLAAALTARGAAVARMTFPRYHADVHAQLARDALYGRLGDLADSVHGMAVLFALDRRDAADELRALRATHDVLLLDRYVASNAAYGAARLRENAHGRFAGWVRVLEIDRFGVPVPDVHLLLRVPVALAATRAAGRAETDPNRAMDVFEADAGLQDRCATVYEQLAAENWLAPWLVVDGSATSPLEPGAEPGAEPASDLAARLLDR